MAKCSMGIISSKLMDGTPPACASSDVFCLVLDSLPNAVFSERYHVLQTSAGSPRSAANVRWMDVGFP